MPQKSSLSYEKLLFIFILKVGWDKNYSSCQPKFQTIRRLFRLNQQDEEANLLETEWMSIICDFWIGTRNSAGNLFLWQEIYACNRKFILLYEFYSIILSGIVFLWQEQFSCNRNNFHVPGRISGTILMWIEQFFLWQEHFSCDMTFIPMKGFAEVPKKISFEVFRFHVNLVARLTVIIPPWLKVYILVQEVTWR